MADVTLRQIRKSYGQMEIIHGVDLEINSGEFIVFVGPSGCGKSTLLRMVAGLEEISGGDLHIGGTRVNDLAPRDRDIAMVFQDYALYPHKTVRDNMAFGLRLRKVAEAEVHHRVNSAAESLQITHLLDRLPKALSGGQRQRVAMGRAIVRQPKLFLFDEPLSNLDALLRNQVRAEIKKMHRRVGKTVIYVTHDQVEAMTLADRIVVLQAGRIVQFGTPDEIYGAPQHRFVAGFTGSPPMNFMPARLSSDAGQMALHITDGPSMVIPADTASRWRQHVGQEVELGIRPENLALADARPDWPAVDCEVELMEPLGAENLLTLRLGGCRTWGASAANRPQRSIFHPLFAPWPGHGAANPAKNGLAGADFRYRRPKSDSLLGAQEIKARVAPDVRPAVGTRLRLALDPARLHLFDLKTGRVL